MVESTRYENVNLARFQRAVISAVFDQSNWNLDVAHLHTMWIAYMESTRYENVKLARFQRVVISSIFDRSNWNFDVAHLYSLVIRYMNNKKTLALCVNRKVDSIRYVPSVARKRKFSPFSEGCNFVNFWSIKLKPWRCTSTFPSY